MKKTAPVLLFSLFLLLFCYCTKAQSYNIIKSQAFFRTSTAGNIAVDENGNPSTSGVKKDYFIYIETKGTQLPQWETAYIDGLPYSIRAVEVTNTPQILSPLKGQKSPVQVSKRSGNRLWQLVVTPQESENQLTEKNNSITLRGTFRHKSITYRITNVQELAKRFNQ